MPNAERHLKQEFHPPLGDVSLVAVIDVRRLAKTYYTHVKQPGLKGSLAGLFRRQIVPVPAVKGISFTVEEGELVGFLGPNGAGKTTALKMLSGIIYPTSGTARVLGYVPWERRPQMQRRFAIVMGQKNQLWWDLPPPSRSECSRKSMRCRTTSTALGSMSWRPSWKSRSS